MKYVDWTVQTALFLSTISCAIISFGKKEIMPLILIFQFFVGAWQVLSLLVSLSKHGSDSPKKLHLIVSLVYILLLIVFSGVLNIPDLPRIWQWIALGYFLGIPWIIAIYHYVLTWKITFNRYKKSSSFLPHISF